MIYLIIFGLILSSIQLFQIFSGGAEAITEGIQKKWLRDTLRILLKVIAFSLVGIGIICTAIVMFACNYNPGKKK